MFKLLLIGALCMPFFESFGMLTVIQKKDSIKIENCFIQVKINRQGGKIASLYDKQNKQEYAFSPEAKTSSGLCKDRIWEKKTWQELLKADFKLEIIRNTRKEIKVRAQHIAVSGPGKGMTFVRTYSLKNNECRLKVNYRIFSNKHWASFSPWLHNLIRLPAKIKDKNSMAVFCQTKRGLFSDTPARPKFKSALLFDAAEPWIGAVSESGKAGLCIITDTKQLNHFYCWYGSEYFFTMETVFRKHKFTPGGSWSTDLWFIMTNGITNYHLAAPQYVAGLSPAGLQIFPTVSMTNAIAKLSIDKTRDKTIKLKELIPGKVFTLPLNVKPGMHNIDFEITNDGKKSKHTVRANAKHYTSEVKPATSLNSSSAKLDNAVALYLKDTVYLSADMPVAIHFGMAENFKKKKKKVELVLEIPASIKIINPSIKAVMGKISHNGKSYTKYRFAGRSRSYYNWCNMFMLTTMKPGNKDKMYYYATWKNGTQKPQLLTIESVKIKACKKIPKRLLAGIGFYGLKVQKRWPDIHKNMKKIGLNTVSLSAADYKNPSKMRKAILEAKNAGMYTSANYSPTCRVPGLGNHKETWVEAIDGTKVKFICPSYRGPVLDEEIKRATSYGEAGASIIFWDAESWRGREFCFCPRCLKRFEAYLKKYYPEMKFISPKTFEKDFRKYSKYHAIWLKFRLSLGTELFLKYKNEYLRRLKASKITGTGAEKFIIGSYDLIPDRIYHQFMRFNEMHSAKAINICMPSLYVAGDALKVANTVKDIRKTIGSSRIIPWITGGADASFECDAINQKYILLELFFNGSMGFTTWPFLGWDALDTKYLSQVMNMITPLENIIVDGLVMKNLTASDKYVRTAGLIRGNEAAILVSDYYHDTLPAVSLKLSVPEAASLFDVATGEKLTTLKAGVNLVKLPAYPENARLLYVGKSAPETSYKCPPEKRQVSAAEKVENPTITGDAVKVVRGKTYTNLSNRFYKVGFINKTGTIAIMQWKSGKKIKSGWFGNAAGFLSNKQLGSITMSNSKVSKFEIKDVASGTKQLTIVTDFGSKKLKQVKQPTQAVYKYTFYAGSPVIKLEINFSQPEGQGWSFGRFNQFNFKDNKWTHVIIGDPGQDKALTLAKKTQKPTSDKKGYCWAGVRDAKNALAIISMRMQPRPFVYVYGPTRMYINGRYGGIKSPKMNMTQYIYVGPGGNDNIRKWAKYLKSNEL
jgi:hypothetical protein